MMAYDLGHEVEMAVADANSRIWEMMNPPADEEPEEEPEAEAYDLYSAERELEYALSGLYDAMNRVLNAADDADGHPVANKITAAYNSLSSTELWLRKIKESITAELLERETRESERRHAI